jgi:hypothetical protein
MRNGCVVERPMTEPATGVTGGSAPPGLLKTPSASLFNDGESLESWEARNKHLRESWSSERYPNGNGNGMGTPLPIAIRQLLKTPTAQLAVNGGSQHPDKRRAGGHGPTLADQVEHSLLPTPMVGDAKMARNSTATRYRTPPTGIHPGDTLTDILLPSGGRIAPQSSSGGELSADARRGQLSLDELESG